MSNLIKNNKEQWAKELFQQAYDEDVRVIEFNGKRVGVVVVDNKTGKTAISYCSPKDIKNYDIRMGVAVAYARLKNISIPECIFRPTYKDIAGSIIRTEEGCYYYIPIVPITQYYKIGTCAQVYSLSPLKKFSTEFLETVKGDDIVPDTVEIVQTREEVEKNY